MVKVLDKCGADNPKSRIKLSENLILNIELYDFVTNINF